MTPYLTLPNALLNSVPKSSQLQSISRAIFKPNLDGKGIGTSGSEVFSQCFKTQGYQLIITVRLYPECHYADC